MVVFGSSFDDWRFAPKIVDVFAKGDCTDRHRARLIVHSRIDLRYRSYEEV
jgi:hypothetical protein